MHQNAWNKSSVRIQVRQNETIQNPPKPPTFQENLLTIFIFRLPNYHQMPALLWVHCHNRLGAATHNPIPWLSKITGEKRRNVKHSAPNLSSHWFVLDDQIRLLEQSSYAETFMGHLMYSSSEIILQNLLIGTMGSHETQQRFTHWLYVKCVIIPSWSHNSFSVWTVMSPMALQIPMQAKSMEPKNIATSY